MGTLTPVWVRRVAACAVVVTSCVASCGGKADDSEVGVAGNDGGAITSTPSITSITPATSTQIAGPGSSVPQSLAGPGLSLFDESDPGWHELLDALDTVELSVDSWHASASFTRGVATLAYARALVPVQWAKAGQCPVVPPMPGLDDLLRATAYTGLMRILSATAAFRSGGSPDRDHWRALREQAGLSAEPPSESELRESARVRLSEMGVKVEDSTAAGVGVDADPSDEEADAYLTALSDHLFQTRRSQSEGVSPGAAEVEILSEELPHHDVTVRVGGADVPISEVLSAGAAVAAASVPAIDHAPSSDENGATSFVDPLCPAE